ncbi:SANT and BTB domain regulator of class switch recombination [Anthophora retusa]
MVGTVRSTLKKFVIPVLPSDVMQKNKIANTTEVLSDTSDTTINNSIESSSVVFENGCIHACDQNSIKDFERYNKITQSTLNVKNTKIAESTDMTENFLITLMKTNLSDILHEGLLDSVLPYMIPKPIISQPIIKKSITSTEVRKSNSLSNTIETRAITNITHKEKEKDKNKTSKKSSENEVEIHVCDEEKNIKRNFHCPQKLLIQKMRYFSDVTAGQKLEEIDISVHCDITIFDWLMRWVKKDVIKKTEWPVLEANNVIPIMVSASFLQMEPLLESCLQYCHDNMSDILKTSTVLTGLDDNLLTRLVELFTNEDVEALKDKKDKIQSKLFCKLIVSLTEVMPDNKKGHYSSLATLFKCSKCGKNIIQSVSNFVPCISSAMKIDNHGNIHSKHIRDLTWNLNDYIVTLRTELRSWRKVYWKLWGRYPCCSQRAYKFEVLSNYEGCRYREHVPDIRTQKDISILNIFTIHREIIAMDPPQLFFPEKITRLVACDLSLQPGKLLCKDVMWWTGIELAPQRQKLGLLGKLWSGSGFRRLSQIHDLQKSAQKVRRQISVTTDASSITSSITDTDVDDGFTTCENSSIGEESDHSEESRAWSSLKAKIKIKRKSRNQAAWRNNGRSWSGNLNVRHNQDNQRDFEESATLQMITLLTKRVSADTSSLLKTSNKHNRTKRQLYGGIYRRLEAELRDQLNQTYKSKNIIGKNFLRTKLNKS